MRRPWAVGVMVGCSMFAGLGAVVGCGSEPKPRVAASTKQAETWPEDPWLDRDQKELLERLKSESKNPLHEETWARAGVVQRLDLDVPSGAPSGSSLEEHALHFLSVYGGLWKLGEAKLQTVGTRERDDCSSVTLQRFEGDLPVMNATLRVTLTPEGRIRAVTGRMTGEAFAIDDRRASQEELATGLSKGFGQGLVPAESFMQGATEIVFDPFFSGDREHEAVFGWMWTGHDSETGGVTRAMVVSQATAGVVFAGQLHPLAPAVPFVCDGQDPQIWLPEVEYDELSQSPMFIGMSHFGGLATSGSTDRERALSAMQFDGVRQLYGDADPVSHLSFVSESTASDGRVSVTFEELWAGIPVEATWVTVVLSPTKRAERIHSRFVYFPQAATQPSVVETTAHTAAVDEYLSAECGSDQSCRAALTAELAQHPVVGRLAVFSGRVFQGTTIPGRSDLGWGYELPRREIWVSATSGLVLASYPRGALHITIPWDIQKGYPPPAEVQIVNGAPVPGAGSDPDVVALNGFVTSMGDFVESRHGWLGVRGDRSGEHFFVAGKDGIDAGQGNAAFCSGPNGCALQAGGNPALNEGDLFFGRLYVADDIVGHEWGHGIVYWGLNKSQSRGPDYICEGASVHEHIADVFGETAFPSQNGAWTIGESALGGVLRSMSQPSSIRDILGQTPFDFWPPHTNPAACTPTQQIYLYAGPADRAATLIADGFNGRPGIGRSALEELYWITLDPRPSGGTSASLAVLGSSVRYPDLRRALHATCVTAIGQTLRGAAISHPTCDMVNRAFVEVGFLDRRVFGVTQVTRMFMGDTRYTFNAYSGLRLHRGCTLTNQRLNAVQEDGRVFTSDWNDNPAMTIDLGEFEAHVSDRGSATDPANRYVQYGVSAKWFGPWSLTFFIDEDIALGPGVTQESDCLAPVGYQARRLVSSQQVNEWAVFLDGNRGSLDINIGVNLPPGCQLPSAAIVGTHWHGDGTSYGDVTKFDHGDHGYEVVPLVPGSYAARVGWWHDGASAIWARAVYNVLEPQGGSCQVPGAAVLPP